MGSILDGTVLDVKMASILLLSSNSLTDKGKLADGPLKVLEYYSWFFFSSWCIKYSLSWYTVHKIMVWSNELKSCAAFLTMFLGGRLNGGNQEWSAVNLCDSFQTSCSSKTFRLNFLGSSILFCIMAKVRPILLLDCFLALQSQA